MHMLKSERGGLRLPFQFPELCEAYFAGLRNFIMNWSVL